MNESAQYLLTVSVWLPRLILGAVLILAVSATYNSLKR